MKLLEQAVEWNAGHFLLWLDLGQCQQALGLIGPARHSFSQARQLNPQSMRPARARPAFRNRPGPAARRGLWRRFFKS